MNDFMLPTAKLNEHEWGNRTFGLADSAAKLLTIDVCLLGCPPLNYLCLHLSIALQVLTAWHGMNCLR